MSHVAAPPQKPARPVRTPKGLVRIDPNHPEHAADEELARQARDLLGYRKRAAAIGIATPAEERLLAALRAEGVHPFSRASVERYQTSKAKARGLNTNSGIGESIAMGLAALVLLGGAVALIMLVLHFTSDLPWEFISWSGGIGLFGLIGLFAITLTSRPKGRWTTTPIAKYTGNIPTGTLHTALRLKRRLPEAEITVEELKFDQPRDPFLVITYEGASAHFEVWDEHDFKGERVL